MFSSLRYRLSFIFISLAVVPAILISIFVGLRSFKNLENQSLLLQRETAANIGGEIKAFIEQREDELILLDEMLDFTQLPSGTQNTLLTNLLWHERVYTQLMLIDVTGEVLVYTSLTEIDTPQKLENQSQNQTFLTVLNQEEIYYSPIHLDAVNYEPLMTIAIPIESVRTGEIVYVLTADMRISTIWDILANMESHSGTDAYVIDQNGLLVAHRNPTIVLRNLTVDIPGTEGRTQSIISNEKVIFSTYTLHLGDKHLTVVAEQTIVSAQQTAISLLYFIAIITFSAIIIAIILIIFSVRNIVRPIEKLSKSAKKIEQEDYSQRVILHGNDEVADLASSFNHMSEHLQQILTSLRWEINERKQAEVSLRESETRYKNLFDNSPVPLWEQDFSQVKQYLDELRASGVTDFAAHFDEYPEDVARCAGMVKLIHGNQASYHLYKIQDTQTDHSLNSYITKETLVSFKESLISLAQGVTSFSNETVNQTVDGELINCIVVMSIIIGYEDTLEKIIVSIIDVTERKRLEADARRVEVLQAELQKEKEIMILKDKFITTVSHEFRTPLAIIQTSTELFTRYGDQLSKERKNELSQQIYHQIGILTEMINNVLEVGRNKSQRLIFKPQSVNLADFCRSIFNQFSYIDKSNHVFEFINELPDEPILIDPYLIQHILENLLSNATKYAPQNTRISLHLDCNSHKVHLSVIDEGIGIPKEDQLRLFEPFHRASNIGNIRGTGLGLSIVKQYVELHNGHIAFKSEENKGSIFKITIPLEKDITDE